MGEAMVFVKEMGIDLEGDEPGEVSKCMLGGGWGVDGYMGVLFAMAASATTKQVGKRVGPARGRRQAGVGGEVDRAKAKNGRVVYDGVAGWDRIDGCERIAKWLRKPDLGSGPACAEI